MISTPANPLAKNACVSADRESINAKAATGSEGTVVHLGLGSRMCMASPSIQAGVKELERRVAGVVRRANEANRLVRVWLMMNVCEGMRGMLAVCCDCVGC